MSYENADFFNALLQDEQHHAAEIDEWLMSLGVIREQQADDRAYF